MADPVVTPIVIAVKAAPLAAKVIVSAASRVRDRALGDEGERGLKKAFERAFERVYHDLTDTFGPDMSGVMDSVLAEYVDDPSVAEALVDVGIFMARPDLSFFRSRFKSSFDAETLPVDLDELLGMLVRSIRSEVQNEVRTNEVFRSRFVAAEAFVSQEDREFLGADHEFTRGSELQEATARITEQAASRILNAPYRMIPRSASQDIDLFLDSSTRYAAVVGPVGIGKTTFMALEARRLVELGWAVVPVSGDVFSLNHVTDVLVQDGLGHSHSREWRQVLVYPWQWRGLEGPKGLVVMVDRFEAGDISSSSRELGMLNASLDLCPESKVKVLVFADTPVWDTVKLKVPLWTARTTNWQEGEVLQVIHLQEFDDAELDAALRSLGHEELTTSTTRLGPRDPRVDMMRSVLIFPAALGLYAKLEARISPSESTAITARKLAAAWLDIVLDDVAQESALPASDIFVSLISVVTQARARGGRSLALEPDSLLAELRTREGKHTNAGSTAFQGLMSHDLFVDLPVKTPDAPRQIEFRQQLLGSLLLSFALETEAAGVSISDFENWASARFLENFTFPPVIDGMLAWLDRLADDPSDVRLAPLVRAAVETRRMRTSIAFRLASSRILPALFLALEENPSDYPYLYREAARHVPITPDALREIRRHLDDPEEQCWELALYLIGIHGDQTDLPEILRVLDSESANGVDTALEALVEMGQVAIPHLCAALRSSDASLRLRRLCAGGLRGIGHRDASVSEAIGQAVKDGESGDSSLLESALLAACVLRDRTHADAAVRGLSHKDPDVVLAAARYLAELPVPEAAESLDEALSVWAGESDQEHRIHTVRRQLAFALAQTGRLDGLHRVVGLLEESLHG